MDLQKRFIEVAATDTVRQVMDKLTEHNKDEDGETYAIWLVVSEKPPWQFSVVKANKLYEVEPADWGKSLDEMIGGFFQRSDAVPQEVLVDDGQVKEEMVREMVHNSPSQVLIAQEVRTTGLYAEGQLVGDCDSRCPNGDWVAYDSTKNSKITCPVCGLEFRAQCDA